MYRVVFAGGDLGKLFATREKAQEYGKKVGGKGWSVVDEDERLAAAKARLDEVAEGVAEAEVAEAVAEKPKKKSKK